MNAPDIISDLSQARVLKGDGTWPFVAYVLGDDIILIHQRATCFGGCDDPQDDGSTASGVSTKDPLTYGISLPMDARGRQMGAKTHAALDGSPIPWLPWRTLVEITSGAIKFTAPLIDVGPGKRTGNAVDLVKFAANHIDPKATSTNFEARVNIRIIGGAKYAPAA